MSARYRGGTVLVTGASAGIGLAASRAFARRGYLVLALARTRERLESLAAEAPGRVFPVVADVASGPSMEAAASRILAEFGPPDVVVANAGIGLDALVSETTDDALRAVFEVNVFGALRTVRPFLAPMARRGSGRILLVSSVLGRRGIPHYAAYCASKFALHGIADALRPEILGTGVSVGILCPSTTKSEFSSRSLRAGPRQKPTRVTLHSAESVARAIVRMAGSRRREKVLSVEGRLLLALGRLFPGLLDRALARALVGRGADLAAPDQTSRSDRR